MGSPNEFLLGCKPGLQTEGAKRLMAVTNEICSKFSPCPGREFELMQDSLVKGFQTGASTIIQAVEDKTGKEITELLGIEKATK